MALVLRAGTVCVEVRSFRGEGPVIVLIYVETSKQVSDRDHLKVFADVEAAKAWFAKNDPEGVAFEYSVLGMGSATLGEALIP